MAISRQDFEALSDEHVIVDSRGCLWEPVKPWQNGYVEMRNPKGVVIKVYHTPDLGFVATGFGQISHLNHPQSRIKKRGS